MKHLPTDQPTLVAEPVAIAATAAVARVIRACPAPTKDLANQALRAASSAALNLSEGAGRTGRDRLHHYRIAYASAKEATTALHLITATTTIPTPTEALTLLDRTRALTWRLLHPRP